MVTIFSINPDYPTGQSIMAETLLNQLKTFEDVEDIKLPAGFKGLQCYLATLIKYTSANKKSSLVIFVGSRSFPGFIRELPFFLISWIIGIKIVFYNHGLDLMRLLKNRIVTFIFKKLDVIFLLPTSYKIPNILDHLDLEYFILKNPSLIVKDYSGLAVEKNKMIYVGNFINGKGQIALMEVIKANINKYALLDFKFYGSISNLSFEYINSNVFKRFYGGQLNRVEINKLYNTSKTLVFLSDYYIEYNPLVVIDAMYMNMLLILLDTSTLRATVGDYKYVFWMKEISDSEWCNALSWSRQNNPKELDGIVNENLSLDNFNRNLKKFINKIIEKP